MKTFLFSLLSSLSFFSFACAQVQIIQSFPIGTELKVPGMADAKDIWVWMIDHSKKTIDIEQMYADGKSGEALDEVISALKRAGNRGVQIRFSLSKNMIGTNPETVESIRSIPNLELRILDLKQSTGGIQHSKFFIFDRETVYVGSQNFDWKSLTHILETGVLIQDRVIASQLLSIFEFDWKMAQMKITPQQHPRAPTTPFGAKVSLVASPPSLNPLGIQSSIQAVIELLRNAKHSVRISLLDMSTYSGQSQWLEVDQELRAAAKRGVKVLILVSHWNTEKPEIDTIKSLSLVKNIQVKIASVPDLSTGHIPYSRVNHSKIMVIDDQIFWVGTSNWSQGYFYACRGIEIIMRDSKLAAQGNEIFGRLWNAPYSHFVDVNRDYPKPVK